MSGQTQGAHNDECFDRIRWLVLGGGTVAGRGGGDGGAGADAGCREGRRGLSTAFQRSRWTRHEGPAAVCRRGPAVSRQPAAVRTGLRPHLAVDGVALPGGGSHCRAGGATQPAHPSPGCTAAQAVCPATARRHDADCRRGARGCQHDAGAAADGQRAARTRWSGVRADVEGAAAGGDTGRCAAEPGTPHGM